ncbi:facilitated trehalose transporter Tret1-like [Cydia pomonella]|uniref:facilitated trehalose transporter Tret1-like n=1 Tax=Cydia pomonella TaxID=82600 RepID=UPI002ADDFAA6|nr:facilitated trehalose transporter Tret1-like [Cydia pomonella]
MAESAETNSCTSFARQTWTVSAVLLNMVAQGMVMSFPSVMLPGLKVDTVIKTDAEMMSWLASVVGLATFPGFLISAFLMEQWGRKTTHALVIVPGILGWLLIYFATNVTTLMAARILSGISAGASVILGAVVIGEYTSPQHRGMFLNLKTAVNYVGNTLVHLVGHYYPWRTVAIFALVHHIIAFGIVCTWPESPAWLATKCKFDQSEKSWMWLRGNDSESRIEFDSMITTQKQSLSKVSEKPNLKTHLMNFLQKFTKKDFMKPLLIIFFAEMLKEACGRHVFPAYALQIMDDITGDKSKSFYYTLSIDLITTLSATFSSALVRVVKRRTLLFVTGGASLAILTGICVYLYLTAIDVISKDRAWLPVSMFMLYFVLTNLGCTVIPLALLGEVFPVAHRGAGSAMSGLILGSFLLICLKITPAMLISVKVHGTFTIYGVAMATCLVALYFILPETKDRTLQEIEDYFNHGRFVSDEKDCDDKDENTKMLS